MKFLSIAVLALASMMDYNNAIQIKQEEFAAPVAAVALKSKAKGDEKKEEAQLMGKKVIDGYHFLVSMDPETLENNLEAYTKTITESGIADFQHKGQLLEVSFMDGSTYEYFGVPRSVCIKLIQSDKQVRFTKRSIYTSYLYRKSKRGSIED